MEPSVREFVDTMLLNSLYWIRIKGDQSNFIEGNNIESEATLIKDQEGDDFASKKMEVITVNGNFKDEPAFGQHFKNRVKHKLGENLVNDPEVIFFTRSNAFAETRQMHGNVEQIKMVSILNECVMRPVWNIENPF